jgi:hypothetical protein
MQKALKIFIILPLTFLLSACLTDRFETFEPYSTFDERMATYDGQRPAPAYPPYPSGYYSDQYAYPPDAYPPDYRPQPAPAPKHAASHAAASASSGNTEVPFDSSRSAGKHPMNVGGMNDNSND